MFFDKELVSYKFVGAYGWLIATWRLNLIDSMRGTDTILSISL